MGWLKSICVWLLVRTSFSSCRSCCGRYSGSGGCVVGVGSVVVVVVVVEVIAGAAVKEWFIFVDVGITKVNGVVVVAIDVVMKAAAALVEVLVGRIVVVVVVVVVAAMVHSCCEEPVRD